MCTYEKWNDDRPPCCTKDCDGCLWNESNDRVEQYLQENSLDINNEEAQKDIRYRFGVIKSRDGIYHQFSGIPIYDEVLQEDE